MQDPPRDERLIGGMFHVLGEKWGWQERVAKQWLAAFVATPAYEAERRRAPITDAGDPGAEVDVGAGEPGDDEDMN
jgi:hypothetical protein